MAQRKRERGGGAKVAMAMRTGNVKVGRLGLESRKKAWTYKSHENETAGWVSDYIGIVETKGIQRPTKLPCDSCVIEGEKPLLSK